MARLDATLAVMYVLMLCNFISSSIFPMMCKGVEFAV